VKTLDGGRVGLIGFWHKLDENNQIVQCSVEEWNEIFERREHQIFRTEIGECIVSTIFLGLNHGGSWFETMVCAPHGMAEVPDPETGELYSFQERYATYEDAKAGHERVCAMARTQLPAPLKQIGDNNEL